MLGANVGGSVARGQLSTDAIGDDDVPTPLALYHVLYDRLCVRHWPEIVDVGQVEVVVEIKEIAQAPLSNSSVFYHHIEVLLLAL